MCWEYSVVPAESRELYRGMLAFHARAAPQSVAMASSGVEKIRNKPPVRVTSNSFFTRELIPLTTIFRPAFCRVTYAVSSIPHPEESIYGTSLKSRITVSAGSSRRIAFEILRHLLQL